MKKLLGGGKLKKCNEMQQYVAYCCILLHTVAYCCILLLTVAFRSISST